MNRLAPCLLSLLLFATSAAAQYNPSAGQNAPSTVRRMPMLSESGEAMRDDKGQIRFEEQRVPAAKDRHGNAQGNTFDLAIDGAFSGQTVLILDQVGNTLVNTVAALKQKGFNTVVFHNFTGPVDELKQALGKSCQVWLISSGTRQLNDKHLAAIKEFFVAGHGVYIWGDNEPLYADANALANLLVPELRMDGNLPGDKVVGISRKAGQAGVRQGHLLTTGLEFLYEGVTIATIRSLEEMTPLLYGSAGNLVVAARDRDNTRLIIDGGFTRLAVNWDDAGTARYVKNAAAWLVNAERFADKVAKHDKQL
jgi:hypothetical protein